MAANRQKIPAYTVIHDVNWSTIFNSLPNPNNWKFDPNSKQKLKDRDACIVSIFSPTECQKLIELTELYGYVDVGFDKDYRSNTRIQTKDLLFNRIVFDRIKQLCPQQLKTDDKTWEICGLNERYRWCKYIKGQKFDTHLDG
eukprot:829981_1